ncbi:dienelactone hydrolase family protein [Diaporthe helianthi]|uniref:Dienelactone hydrolase family protein n=1 Tax=Diaporthe helianthi TaxID=158607 RepID=A0A2P5ICE4_DIAHE|nr:dienelactone hydrolase family protein [Diaporthe helianthi]
MSCKACEELPPVSAEYTEKGKYETIDGLKTYVTGPANATRAVIDIYDVFGLASQTLQGADRLSQHIGDCLVFVPDLLDGNYVKPEWLPPDTPEKQKLFGEFRAGPGNAQKAVERVMRVRREIGEKYPAVEGHTNKIR